MKDTAREDPASGVKKAARRQLLTWSDNLPALRAELERMADDDTRKALEETLTEPPKQGSRPPKDVPQ